MDADLYNAVVEGDISGIENLSEKIDQVTEDGDTILHIASLLGKTECVQFILTQFANEELLVKIDRNGRSALHYAAFRGHTDAVELLINAARGLSPSSEFESPSSEFESPSSVFEEFFRRADHYVEILFNVPRGLPSSEFEKFIRQADWQGDTALHLAIRNNNVETVQLLVNADPNHKYSVNSDDESPLYIAAKWGFKDIVQVICESCTTPSFDGPYGQTALHAAIDNCDTDTVELLINAARGFLPSSEFEKFIRHIDVDGDTALHLAVYQNKVEAVKLLVTADPNHKHSSKVHSTTPLYMAAKWGYKDIVQVICESCTSLSFDGPDGKTVLHAAIENRDTVELLINGATRFLPSSEFKKFIRQADVDGNTALHEAVYRNQVEVVKLLVNADPNHIYPLNNLSKTPLYTAAEQGYKDIVKVICESCTSPTFDGSHGRTALQAAVENRDTDSVRSILDKIGLSILERDDKGWTAVDYAASKNFLSVLDILIKTERDQFYHDYSAYKQFFMDRPQKETAIHRAAFEGRIFTVLQLMKLYPDFIWCAVTKDGQNILHIAVDQNYKELVQAILQYCPDLSLILNTKDEKGNTPLHLLVMRGLFILELIRHEGVDRNAKNNENFTPYELLYLDEEIIADQLKIKEAFEDSELINQRWKFGLRKRNIPELITAESLVVPSTRYIKDAKFKKERNLLLKEEIKLYRERTNTQIIVTALITTVTFTVGFTMPGGYHQEEGQSNQGSAVLSKKTAFRVFMVADTIALLLSTSSLFSYFMASMYQDPHEVSKLMSASTGLNIVSIVAMMLTFITGTYVVLPHSGLALTVCIISCIFFLHVIFLLIKWMYDPIEKFKV